MDHNDKYYKEFSAEFLSSTVGVDMAPIRQKFLAQLGPQAHILDAGCGSGPDARAFAEAGFQVSAFDASAELSRLASAHCGVEVPNRRFTDVDEVAQFDGHSRRTRLQKICRKPDVGIASAWTALHGSP